MDAFPFALKCLANRDVIVRLTHFHQKSLILRPRPLYLVLNMESRWQQVRS